MNLDDETLLSAYLDGELPPEEGDRVDSTLVSDSGLADRLRDLVAVRDLVASLSRPSLHVDLASSVLARIENQSAFRPRRWALPRSNSWGVRIAALTAAAATLLITTTIVVNRQLRRPADSAPSPLAVAQPATRDAGRAVPPDRADRPAPPPSVADASAPSSPAVPAARIKGAARDLRGLLENPQLQKVLLVTDVLGGQADARIGEMIQNTPRRNPVFGRIVVHQGIVIDPAHAGEAVVFALILNESELLDFQKKLALAFPSAVEDASPRPDLALKLSEVGQITVHPGLAVADLKRQPSLLSEEASIALMSDPRADAVHQKSILQPVLDPGVDPLLDAANGMAGRASELVVVPRDEPTPEQYASAPAPFRNRAESAPVIAPAERPARDLVVGPPAPESVRERVRDRQAHPLVLVWIATRPEHAPTGR